MLLNRLRFSTIVLAVMSSVYPSGGAVATASVPILPLAPGRFSITTAIFQSSPIRCPSVRARMSMPGPGVNGTMSLIGLLGYVSCAQAAPPAPSVIRNAAVNIATTLCSMVNLPCRPSRPLACRTRRGRGRRRTQDAGDTLVPVGHLHEFRMADDIVDPRERAVARSLVHFAQYRVGRILAVHPHH